MAHLFNIGIAAVLCFTGFFGLCLGIVRAEKARPNERRGCFDETDAFAGLLMLVVGVVMMAMNW